MPFVDTPEFGRVGAAICFDFNFPSFMLQASKNKIDLMLQASWTWGKLTYNIVDMKDGVLFPCLLLQQVQLVHIIVKAMR